MNQDGEFGGDNKELVKLLRELLSKPTNQKIKRFARGLLLALLGM